MVKGFHVQDGLYFTRGENGAVTVTVTEAALNDSAVLRSFTFDVDAFASVVASMSARGEENGGFYEAQRFLARAPKGQGEARFTSANSESGEICPNRKNGECTVDW